jgi:ABC-type glutathione transport system ATPase component
VDLLKEIEEWSTDPSSKCIVWLNGMAGTGKSTIARTVARKLDTERRLGASFFFSRDSVDLNNADRFLTTLAFQLTRVSPNLKDYICNAITDRQDINTVALQDQWKELIFKLLKKSSDNLLSSSPLIFVIDALDECNSKDIREIVRLLVRELEAVKV